MDKTFFEPKEKEKVNNIPISTETATDPVLTKEVLEVIGKRLELDKKYGSPIHIDIVVQYTKGKFVQKRP